jgi:hypothetical protein
MNNAGYNFTTAGENIALTTSSNPLTDQNSINLHQFLFVDLNYPGRGHRVNILLGDYQEIGVGQAAGNYQGSNGSALTEDFGTRGNQQFLTGVSYADADHNNFYSIGEGRASMSVSAGGSTSTGAAGGYSLAVSSGVQTVTFSNGGLASPINVSVSIAANTNAKVDVIDQGTITTSASLTDLGGATTIIGLGTFGLTLTGDAGNDKFIGTKGNDTINGLGGTDTVVYSGNASAYTRTTLGNGSIQVAGQDGTDTLSNVELLQFADQTIAVGPAAGAIVINNQTVIEGNSGTKVATFTVTRSGGTAAFDVNFATANGSATVADSDYVACAGTLHFGDSVNSQTISVTINGDRNVEPSETFTVNLSGATNGATISDSQGVGTIANDEYFGQPATKLAAFNPANGWTSQDQFPRHLADVNGDGNADIVAFGNGGVHVSLANGSGGFGAQAVTLAGAFNPGNGWTSDNSFHRELADVNGDHMADIVGFSNGGVYVSLATGGGNFAPFSIGVQSGQRLDQPGPVSARTGRRERRPHGRHRRVRQRRGVCRARHRRRKLCDPHHRRGGVKPRQRLDQPASVSPRSRRRQSRRDGRHRRLRQWRGVCGTRNRGRTLRHPRHRYRGVQSGQRLDRPGCISARTGGRQSRRLCGHRRLRQSRRARRPQQRLHAVGILASVARVSAA